MKHVLLLISLFLSQQAMATYITGCTTDSFTLTSMYSTSTTDDAAWTGAIDSTRCIGPAYGSLPDYYNNPSPNIGQEGDGLLNGQVTAYTDRRGNTQQYQSLTDNQIAFLMGHTDTINEDLGDIDSRYIDVDGIDKNGDGNFADDPGWIHLAEKETGYKRISYEKKVCKKILGKKKCWMKTKYRWEKQDQVTYDEVEKDGVHDLSDYLDFRMADGEWFLEVADGTNEFFFDVLNKASFDHLTFVVDTGSQIGIYDFDFNVVSNLIESEGLIDIDPLGDYTFSGTYNADDFYCATDFKTVNIWARDPPVTSEIPVPGPLALLGLGLVGLTGFSRFRG